MLYNAAMSKYLFRKILNCRDLGGYETTDGRHLKNNLFYRSGGLYLFNEKELSQLETLGIKTVLDLRTTAECLSNPDPVLNNAKMYQTSGLIVGQESIDFSPNGMRQLGKAGENQLEVLKDYYQRLPYDNEALKVLFREIKENNLPIIFHCASGKDRTGVAAMMILLLLGVDEETVLNDYLLSNEFCKKALKEDFKRHKHLLEEHPELKELLQMMNGVSENIGKAVLENMKKKYPSIEEYFCQQYDYTSDDIIEIRNRCLK